MQQLPRERVREAGATETRVDCDHAHVGAVDLSRVDQPHVRVSVQPRLPGHPTQLGQLPHGQRRPVVARVDHHQHAVESRHTERLAVLACRHLHAVRQQAHHGRVVLQLSSERLQRLGQRLAEGGDALANALEVRHLAG